MKFFASFCLALVLAALAGAEGAEACEVLPVSALQQHIEVGSDLKQNSQIPSRCAYAWRKADYAQLREQQDAQIRAAMRRGSESQTPISLYGRVEAEVLLQADGVSAAKEAFARYVHGRQEKSYGSPDPLAQAQWQETTLTGDAQAVWAANSRRLLVRKDKTLVLLSVHVYDKAEKDLELAQKLAAHLHLDVSADNTVIRS